MNDGALFILLFWGVWLLIPIISDGFSTLWHTVLSLGRFYRHHLPPLPAENLPRVSVVIPAYNEEFNIDLCLRSLKSQTYPHHLIEIIVVNDGSQDGTSNSVLRHTGSGEPVVEYPGMDTLNGEAQPFSMIYLIRRSRDAELEHGKPAAVNTALKRISGEIVVAIDSDVVLEPDAIEYAVRAFVADDRLVAATGHLIVDPYLVPSSSDENVQAHENNRPTPQPLSRSQRFLAACQFIEYATAFHLGRHSEGAVDAMFTMSGACAVFRREVFDLFGGYRGRTVSEDTDMTLTLHQLDDYHVGYLPGMRVHLEPVLSWASLHAQRIRWYRGALEVSAVHLMSNVRRDSKPLFWRLALPLRLQVDHTLALPRLAWTFMIFMMPLFGYAWSTIASALALLAMFYMTLNVLRTLTAYLFSQPPEKVLLRRYLSCVPFLPLYNMFLYWVRMSALIKTLTEEATWTVDNSLLLNLENGYLQRTLVRAATKFAAMFS
jgi:poly-beta-1,6-N-acetyl-D-glucosamine synthase